MTTYEICKRCTAQLALMQYSPEEDVAPYIVPTGHCYKCELEDDSIDYLVERFHDRGPWYVHYVPADGWAVYDGDTGYEGTYPNKAVAERYVALNNYWLWRDKEGDALPLD